MAEDASDGAALEIDPIDGGLRIRGEVDLSNIERFSSEIQDAASSGRRLILDLAGCEYMGSEAIGVLIEAWKRVRDGGGLVLDRPGRTLRRVLELAGLEKFPDIEIREAS